MLPTEIGGLPAHVLLVHVVVVLVPLTALLLSLSVLWPAFARRVGIGLPIVAFVAVVTVPLTTHAGEWLRARADPTPLVRQHAQLGDGLLRWVAGLFLLSALLWAWHYTRAAMRRQDSMVRRTVGTGWPLLRDGRLPLVVSVAFALLTLAVSAGSVVQVYRVGDSGARAAWTGKFTQQARPEARDREGGG